MTYGLANQSALLRDARAAQEQGEPPTVARLGEYVSSPVVALVLGATPKQVKLQTQNSVWLLTEVEPMEDEIKKGIEGSISTD